MARYPIDIGQFKSFAVYDTNVAKNMPVLRAPSATAGQVLVADASGNFLPGNVTATGAIPSIASSTDNALARWDGTGGDKLKNSVAILSNAGVLSGLTGLTSSGTVTLVNGVTLGDGSAGTVNIIINTNVRDYAASFSGEGVITFTYTGSPPDNNVVCTIGTNGTYRGDLNLARAPSGTAFGGALSWYIATDHSSTWSRFYSQPNQALLDFGVHPGGIPMLRLDPTTTPKTVRCFSTQLRVDDDIACNGGDLTSTATTFNLLNSTVTTLNIGGAATTWIMGATTGRGTIRNANLSLPNLPTSASGLSAGDIWVDTSAGNVLKRV